MAELSIVLEPREDELELRGPTGMTEPDLLHGKVALSINGSSLADKPDATPFLEGGMIPHVLLADLLWNLLRFGLKALQKQKGMYRLVVSGSQFEIVLRAGPNVIRIDIVHGAPEKGVMSWESFRPPKPLLIGEVSKRQFAQALLDSANSLLDEVGGSRPDVLQEDPFWGGEIQAMAGKVREWLGGVE